MWEEGWGPECKPWDKGATMENVEVDLDQPITIVHLGTHEGPLLSYAWARMAKLAWPRLETHLGDLYHDAIALERQWELRGRHLGSLDFYFGVRESGTSFVLPDFWPDLKVFDKWWWHVAITKDRGVKWTARFEMMD